MYYPIRRLSGIFVVVVVGGCATAGTPSAPQQLSTQPVAFDGNYTGTIRVVTYFAGISENWCEAPPRFSFPVKNNLFTFTVGHPNVPSGFSRTFLVRIDPSGSFYSRAVDGRASMFGRVAGTRLDAQVEGEGCTYAIAAQRSGTQMSAPPRSLVASQTCQYGTLNYAVGQHLESIVCGYDPRYSTVYPRWLPDDFALN
jgi:hypothetical protein